MTPDVTQLDQTPANLLHGFRLAPGMADDRDATAGPSPAGRPLRVAMMLPGLGRVQRGAEAAFLELARQFARSPDVRPVLFGSGVDAPPGVPIRGVGCIPRERFEGWPSFPCFRSDCHYEEFTYALSLAASRRFRASDFDVVLCCSYPHLHWFLRWAGRKLPLAFVTQNGDWPCRSPRSEFRFFRCDGLVCTNPEYYERNRARYRSALIPNGVDPDVFTPSEGGASARPGVPEGARVVLMVSALIPSKNVLDGVRAVSQVPDVFLLLAGDGPGRKAVAELAGSLLPGRHALVGALPRERMPELYRRADAFLHMSRDEPFGIVYLEAASSGLPMVVHDGPTTRWILGETALYCDTGDPRAVADALVRALEPGRVGSLGVRARRRVIEGWTWEAQAAKYRDFLRGLVAPRARGEAS